jgi:hypothetical protein
MERETEEDSSVARGCLGLDCRGFLLLNVESGFRFLPIWDAKMFATVSCVARDFNRRVDLDELKGNRVCIKRLLAWTANDHV